MELNTMGMVKQDTMQMENTGKKFQVTLAPEALAYLCPKDPERASRMDAYRSLLSLAINEKRKDATIAGTTVQLHKGQFPTTISDLAKLWKWNRVSVRQFLRRLREHHMAQITHYTKFIIVTMDYTDSSEERPRLFTEYEQQLTRWLCGYISVEEMANSSVNLLFDSETLNGLRLPDETTSCIGLRIHKLMSHIILQYTDILPHDDKIIDALEELFTKYCEHDYTTFWLLITSYAIDRFGTDLWVKNLKALPPSDIGTKFPDDLQRILAIIADYYVPLLRQGTHTKKLYDTATPESVIESVTQLGDKNKPPVKTS